MAMERREFLKVSLAGAAASAALTHAPADAAAPAATPAPAAAAATPAPGQLPRRQYGRHPVDLSILAFPGFCLKGVDQAAANQAVVLGIEKGVNYFDVAPQYGDSEIKLGPALKPHREKVFLACKTAWRTAEKAKEDFERSLERLQTDHFDLYQLHALRDIGKDVDAAFAKGGCMEFILDAQKAGKIKYLGFSSHTVEAALAAMDRFDFDSILFPVTYHAWYGAGFGPTVLAKAKEKKVAVLGMKGMARQAWTQERRAAIGKDWPRCWYEPATDPKDVELALRWTLSQEGVVAAVPPADIRLYELALRVSANLTKPVTPAENDQLQLAAKSLQPLFRLGAKN